MMMERPRSLSTKNSFSINYLVLLLNTLWQYPNMATTLSRIIIRRESVHTRTDILRDIFCVPRKKKWCFSSFCPVNSVNCNFLLVLNNKTIILLIAVKNHLILASSTHGQPRIFRGISQDHY